MYFLGGAFTRKDLASLVEEMAMRYPKIKDVFVTAYTRFRFGKLEFVCQHWRSHPGQLELFV